MIQKNLTKFEVVMNESEKKFKVKQQATLALIFYSKLDRQHYKFGMTRTYSVMGMLNGKFCSFITV